MNVVIGAKTDPGRRPNNEDQLAVVDVRRLGLRADGLLVIADGMGGRSAGERAAAVAVQTVQDTLIEMLSSMPEDEVDINEALASALRKANARVYELGRRNEGGQGMGTTCVAAVIQEDVLSVAHAGDSRAYLMRDGRLEQLTADHSYVAEQVRAGTITLEGARRSRFRNVITRAVGIEPTITPDVSQHQVRTGDNLLLCTDGLTNMVPEDQIAQIVLYAPTPQAAADRLIQIANRNGGKDNITAVVARLEVSNRTEQIRAANLPGAAARSRPQPLRAGEPGADTDEPEMRDKSSGTPPPLRLPLWPTLAAVAAVLVVLLLGFCASLVHVLHRAGYEFQMGSPLFTKPAPPPPPAPPDLSQAHYAKPSTIFVKPVQGGLLSLDGDGALTVVTLSNQVVRLAPDGSVLSQSPESASLPPIPADGNQHFAADPQGNIYVADAAARTISRYTPNGPTDVIQPRWLQRPAALAIGADGTIYVIDAERLKVLRPLPPGSVPSAGPPSLVTPHSASPALSGAGGKATHSQGGPAAPSQRRTP